MKVACIGNTNNNLFSLTRYLRDRGVETDLLLLDNETEHFHPSADTFDRDFETYTRDVPWGSAYHLHGVPADRIRADLAPYDSLIGCSSAPAAAYRIGRPLDIFIPFGGDLYAWPFFRIVNPRHQIAYCRFSRAQRLGIRAARSISMAATNEETEVVLQKIGFRGERLDFGVPMVYAPLYNPEAIARCYGGTPWYHEFRRLRGQYDLIVFYHGRHIWKHAPDRFSWKGTDRLLRGFAMFVASATGAGGAGRPRAGLVTFEYGSDVQASRDLVSELGIADHVHWFPRMTRKEIMVGLSLADIATGEFHHSWLACGTIYEALAMAKPLLHYRDDRLYEGRVAELYPLMNARSAEEIAAALKDFQQRPDHYREMGLRGRDWFQRFAVDEPLDAYLRVIRAAGHTQRAG
jgi:glycosyltransferase involved in cell wall biosynthesis